MQGSQISSNSLNGFQNIAKTPEELAQLAKYRQLLELGKIDEVDIEGKPLKEGKKSQFLEKFEKIKSEQVRNELESIFSKIENVSEKIGDKLYLKDILEYKKLVKEFLQVATSNSHQFTNENFLDRRGRHRSYSLVKTVDRELDSLTKDFINGQIDHMGVIKKMDSIKGMLIDIMM